MEKPVFLITPPFTQLNTPYPATVYLKGFLNTLNISSYQADLGIEVLLKLLGKNGLIKLFKHIESKNANNKSENALRIIALQNEYLNTIDSVIAFLQGKNTDLAHIICKHNFLPQASRFTDIPNLDQAFGSMGIQDKAKHLATLYIEDLFDLIVECVDENFGLTRYAERLARSANNFNTMYEALQQPHSCIETILIELLEAKINTIQPKLVALSVPFPGNLLSALRCAQWVKKHHPKIKIAMGGGFVNTELRSVSDPKVFEFVDYILLDDGEAPLQCLIEHIDGKRDLSNLKRCFICENNKVIYINDTSINDYNISQTGTPDYTDLFLNQYLSVIEVTNPMHSLWSNGRWNKLTMAHGCYWAKCSFCDTYLDYIKRYEPLSAVMLCDRIEQIISQTKQTGFHFVDEAAPPTLMRELALEILRRKLTITWWTNIRFEKNFTADLCTLLKASGCIAISGGLEVASNRLLKLINKGVTVEQVAKVANNFTQSSIMVHAYLMYGFPSQTVQETIDSLEMVRQLFQQNIIHSAFWHQFTMTVHSAVGANPNRFETKCVSIQGTFANNDLEHSDKTGIKHTQFGDGLKTALYNYMHNTGFSIPLQQWFGFKTPRTTIPSAFIANALNGIDDFFIKPDSKLVWLNSNPTISYHTKTTKGKQVDVCELSYHTKVKKSSVQLNKNQAEWLMDLLQKISVNNGIPRKLSEAKKSYELILDDNFELFWYSKPLITLRKNGLLSL